MGTVLDWRYTGDAGDLEPCVVCGEPAMCRSPRGRPCHKTCAERWHDTHDNASGRAPAETLTGGSDHG